MSDHHQAGTADTPTTSAAWQQACGELIGKWCRDGVFAQVQLERHGQAVASMPPEQQATAILMLRGSDDLISALLDLHKSLDHWISYQDHGTSRAKGLLGEHLATDLQIVRHLFAAIGAIGPQILCAAPDVLAKRMRDSMWHIMHAQPIDEGSHRQLRVAIGQLRDRARWWDEHPGDAFDAEELGRVLMPIIHQLLEHEWMGGAA